MGGLTQVNLLLVAFERLSIGLRSAVSSGFCGYEVRIWVGRLGHTSILKECFSELPSLFARESPSLTADADVPHEQHDNHLDHDQRQAEACAATDRYRHRHYAKEGRDEIDHEHNFFSLGGRTCHQVMDMIAICPEHAGEAPHVRTLGLRCKANDHDEKGIDDREPEGQEWD